VVVVYVAGRAGPVGHNSIHIAGILLLAGNPNALEWLMPGFLFSFVAGLLSSWILLVEIRR
jgi:hypothetical protein